MFVVSQSGFAGRRQIVVGSKEVVELEQRSRSRRSAAAREEAAGQEARLGPGHKVTKCDNGVNECRQHAQEANMVAPAGVGPVPGTRHTQR